MPGKFEAPRGGGAKPPRTGETVPHRPRRRKRRRFNPLFLVTIAVLLAAIALMLTMCGKSDEDKPGKDSVPTSVPTEQTEAAPTVTASATVASMGDLLMHSYLFSSDPRFTAASYIEKGVYNFDTIFQYVKPYIEDADYGVANLETTFGGTDRAYSGNPLFNCPDALADSVAKAGFDMLLTANNHCVDSGAAGVKRTLEQVRSRNLATLGSQLDDTEKKYAVLDVNGIKIGMLCYTYAGGLNPDGSPNFNLRSETVLQERGLVNYFTADKLEQFYSDVQTHLDSMRSEGAEATILFIHWGTEYTLSGDTYTMTEDATQRTIAQKMCDLGIDAIIGGHPHVVEPMDLLTSNTDPTHKTACIYSLGNAVSNQRREEMNMKTGHTEDGVIFSVTFEKYSDGSVALAAADVIPTWVNKFVNSDGKVEYNILPLDLETKGQWQALYRLTDAQFTETQNSYNRTMEIVSSGLAKCQTYFDGLKQPNTLDLAA